METADSVPNMSQIRMNQPPSIKKRLMVECIILSSLKKNMEYGYEKEICNYRYYAFSLSTRWSDGFECHESRLETNTIFASTKDKQLAWLKNMKKWL